jgi:hypothetical protein
VDRGRTDQVVAVQAKPVQAKPVQPKPVQAKTVESGWGAEGLILPCREVMTASLRRAQSVDEAMPANVPVDMGEFPGPIEQAIINRPIVRPTGRRRVLADHLDHLIAASVGVIFVVGPPGSGKQTLVSQAISRIMGKTCWAIVELPAVADGNFYTRFYQRLGLGDPPSTFTKCKNAITRCIKHMPLVLVIYGVDRLDQPTASMLVQWQVAGNLRIVVTSRHPLDLVFLTPPVQIDIPPWTVDEALEVTGRIFRNLPFPEASLRLVVKRAVCRANIVDGVMRRVLEEGNMTEILDLCRAAAAVARRRGEDCVSGCSVPVPDYMRRTQAMWQVRELSSSAKMMLLALEQETQRRIYRDEARRQVAKGQLCAWLGIGEHVLCFHDVLADHSRVVRGFRDLQARLLVDGIVDEAGRLSRAFQERAEAEGRRLCDVMGVEDQSIPRALRRINVMLENLLCLERELDRVPGMVGLFGRLCREARPRAVRLDVDRHYRLPFDYILLLESSVPAPIREYAASLHDHCDVPFLSLLSRYQGLLRPPLDPKKSELEPLAFELGRTHDPQDRRRIIRSMSLVKTRTDYREARHRVKMARWHATEECALGLCAQLVHRRLLTTRPESPPRMSRVRHLRLVHSADFTAQMLRLCPKPSLALPDPDYVREHCPVAGRSGTRACKLSRRQVGMSSAVHSDTSDDEVPDHCKWLDSDTSDSDDNQPAVPQISSETRNLFDEVFGKFGSAGRDPAEIQAHIRSLVGGLVARPLVPFHKTVESDNAEPAKRRRVG